MTNAQKAELYDSLLHESDQYQRENSRLKSQYVTNIPPDVQAVINENNRKISILVSRLEHLVRNV